MPGEKPGEQEVSQQQRAKPPPDLAQERGLLQRGVPWGQLPVGRVLQPCLGSAAGSSAGCVSKATGRLPAQGCAQKAGWGEHGGGTPELAVVAAGKSQYSHILGSRHPSIPRPPHALAASGVPVPEPPLQKFAAQWRSFPHCYLPEKVAKLGPHTHRRKSHGPERLRAARQGCRMVKLPRARSSGQGHTQSL